MQKNILILGLGAFGFAIAKHLGENKPNQNFYASEVNNEIFEHISTTRTHPYFFTGAKLPHNIELLADTQEFLPQIDLVISVIPCQFVGGAFEPMKYALKDDVIILNLSKGIDNQSLQTVSEKLSEVFTGKSYTYGYLAGGMIAQELVDGKVLGADIMTKYAKIGEFLKDLFESNTLHINLKIGNPKNTELYAALKNIIALILGFYEGQGAGASTLGYYFSVLISEMQGVIVLLDGNQDLDFRDFALSGDLIATCFGGSRNRLLGNLFGEGKSIQEALEHLESQKKIAEGYETLKGVYSITQGKKGFQEINSFGEKFL